MFVIFGLLCISEYIKVLRLVILCFISVTVNVVCVLCLTGVCTESSSSSRWQLWAKITSVRTSVRMQQISAAAQQFDLNNKLTRCF